jgi:D-hexose-6-phosphate mutarotase
MRFAVQNTGSEPFSYEAALHTYLSVADVRVVSITGLENTAYVDKVSGGTRRHHGAEPLRFTGETDRVFLNTSSTCVLHDPGLNRQLTVAKTGSSTTVVWNPWEGKAAAMSDFGKSEWPRMACIETANAGENAITLPAGESHEMTATISVS